MTEQEILEGNILIAEFMGWEVQKDIKNLWYSNNGSESISRPSSMEFHSSWSWLMPVVEKIESLGYKFQICRKRVTIIEDKGSEIHICTTKHNSKMETVFVACCNFINYWGNLGILGTRP